MAQALGEGKGGLADTIKWPSECGAGQLWPALRPGRRRVKVAQALGLVNLAACLFRQIRTRGREMLIFSA